MAIQEVQWFQVCAELTCPMCETLADVPGVKLTRKVRLNSKRDGWIIVEYSCPDCGFNPPAITASIDPAKTGPTASAIIAPTEEEIEEVQRKPAPRKSIIVEPVRPNVEVDELLAHAEKEFLPKIKMKDGKILELKVTKWGNSDASGIKVTYSDGAGTTLRDGEKSLPNPFHVERTIFCSPDLPGKQEMLDWVMARVSANNQWNNPAPRRVVTKPSLNSGRSRLRVTCSECGDTSGDCGCPGILKNIASPSGIRANTNLLQAPDGSPVETLQHRLAPETLDV